VKPIERIIDAGRVHCPVRDRDVDIEACATCGNASAIELDAKPPVVRCRPLRVPDWLRAPWA
jgi:hypothetical protein